ncbi:hypothetical protein BU23DRAFT_590221 [Bimuria novae-zelandiae CBS 107.79]|uniref:Small secreted protein n=1 Tax=Bimuria novae-zelandiae CBS 107.79 TaxID=1447943 RepID=A0A6A5V7S0_9PLEO|nr:hypothetical protein BU23DRAFT_590221 [Bimuria novae-zelandiae CBS 107.79]
MHFSAITVLSLTALSVAAPITKRQSILGSTTYDAISISGGTAGNAQKEALAVFSSLDTANPENISAEDQDILNEVNQVANDAEKEAFNPAIAAATGEEADALQRGKIKNKVLKLQATVLKLQAQQAQGDASVAAKLEEEQTKLQNNIDQDVAEAGAASTALPFDATIGSADDEAATDDEADDEATADDEADDEATADDEADD